MRGKTGLLLAVLLAALTVVAACGGGGGGGGSTTNYSPHTLNSTWTYLDTQGTSTKTIIALITQSSSTGYSLKYSNSITSPNYNIEDFVILSDGAWGITKLTRYIGDVVSDFFITSPPQAYIPARWDIGYHEIGSSSTYTYDITVIGFESVTVPVGTFNALKLSLSTTESGTTFTIYDWFADGVGIVKSESEGDLRVLTSYMVH